jgi:uncharacterized membrane protein YphA (DoxX/SURF4 family)
MNSELLAAVLITLMYIISGFSKINNFAQVSAEFASKWNVWLILAQFIILLVIILEIVGPAVIIADKFTLNYKYASKIACYLLAGFTVLATLMYHSPPVGEHFRPFLGNLVAIGAFLILSRI